MNNFVIYYVSGWAFYLGLGLILLAVAGTFLPTTVVRNYLFRFVAILGGLNIFFSATPMPYLIAIPLFVLLLIQLIINGNGKIKSYYKKINGITLAIFTILACLFELPYWFAKPIELKNSNIIVIGDSVSGGIGFKGEKTWSNILTDEFNYNVANKSVGGSTVAIAINSLQQATVNPNDLIIIEIGGNDIFRDTTAADFHKNLDRLLADAKQKSQLVVMLELPLPFTRTAFGRSQRTLAKKYHITLIPKYRFAAVFAGANSTVDGLHLANKGHRKMAEMILTYLNKSQ